MATDGHNALNVLRGKVNPASTYLRRNCGRVKDALIPISKHLFHLFHLFHLYQLAESLYWQGFAWNRSGAPPGTGGTGTCTTQKLTPVPLEAFTGKGLREAEQVEQVEQAKNGDSAPRAAMEDYGEFLKITDKIMNDAKIIEAEINDHIAHQGSACVGFDHDSVWQTDDRGWFAENPTRSYRLRYVHDGEPVIGGPFVLVKQVIEGARARLGVAIAGGTDDEMSLLFGRDPLTDTVLAMIAEGVRTRTKLPLRSIIAQGRVLHSMTRH